jgi:NAD(P)-dependent dehydrogenase (short-subunit alcohol dehydrogenase family)
MSNSESTQRIVITGSGSGFGLLTAKSLLTLGYVVVATMRDSTTHNASKAAELSSYSTDTSGELTVVELEGRPNPVLRAKETLMSNRTEDQISDRVGRIGS